MASSLRRLSAVLLASTLAVTACSRAEDTQSSDEAGSSASNERVAALGLGDADTLLALGIKPVAVASISTQAEGDGSGVEPWAKELLGDAKPTVIYGTGQGYSAEIIEQITATDPSKIIAVNSAVDAQAKEALEKIAPTTLKPEGTTDWQIPWDKQVTQIAQAVDKKDEGEDLIEKAEKAFEDFRKAHPEMEGKKAAAVMPYDGKISVYTSGDGRGQFIEDLGFEIPEALEGTDGAFFQTYAPENYQDLNQLDYLFVLDYNGTADALKSDETFQNLDITRDGRVYYMDTDTSNAMSMPNPVTIPWAIKKFDEQL
ncbi:iron-siderophore ABC transporter substrate-binding protein [Corynebacterium lowii]|uniref:Fe(3+)-citrate-binding protein YfmC n=1 Tax=Corynebacterium lowii TaxID=1544413 RepID=A0A0Q1DX46_9CORY|nr:iron-siderophore ABC transporter substrate-binding protein [Corynebacterium lowii]KQB84797.1 Fe(3+)-citrate-binding protein YfmC precursor [Corynebacterium lowii]MDP9851701.1 iron complex transport system substrate-binding protein [Corynebacterium lowii]